MSCLNLKTLSNYKDKPSLLFFSSGLGAGGAEAMLLRIAKHFKKNDCNVFIINLTKQNTLEQAFKNLEVDVIPLPISRPIVFLTRLFLLRRFFKEINLTAIIGWMYLGCLASSLFTAILPGKHKLYWSIRQSLSFWHSEKWLTRIIIHLARILSPHPDNIIYNSNLALSQHCKFGFSKSNARYIANGFDILSDIEITKNRAKYRQEFGFKKSDLIIGMVGRYHPVKGYDLFSEAIQKNILKKLPDNLQFIIIGANVSEYLTPKLPKAVLEQNRIQLVDRRGDAAKIMASFDALLVTSHAEAFPNVVGEAMAAKIPVISTDVGDVRMILSNDRGIYTAGALNELTQQIEAFCNLSEHERLAWGEQNRETVSLHYDIKHIVLSYAKTFGIN